MKKNDNKTITIQFTSQDFYNVYEEQNFLDKLYITEDIEKYIKQATINRSIIEGQGEKNHYDKLMGYIQSKGIDYIIERIEGKKDDLNEERVRDIVREMISGMEIVRSKSENNLFSGIDAMIDEKVVNENKKKASSKLMKL